MPDSSGKREMFYGEFTLKRVLDAPRELVWVAWTDPEQIARWWGPLGMSTPLSTIELDLRPDGIFSLTMVSNADGSEYRSEMVLREIVEPERLSFGWGQQRGMGSGEITVTFRDLGDRTEMTIKFAGWNTEQMHRSSKAGWASSLDSLARHLRQVPGQPA